MQDEDYYRFKKFVDCVVALAFAVFGLGIFYMCWQFDHTNHTADISIIKQSKGLLYSIGDTVEVSTINDPITIIGYYYEEEDSKGSLALQEAYDYIGVSYNDGFISRGEVYCFAEDDIGEVYQPEDDNIIGSVVQLSYSEEPIVVVGYYNEGITCTSYYRSPDAQYVRTEYYTSSKSGSGKYVYDYVGVPYDDGYTYDSFMYCFMEDDIEDTLDNNRIISTTRHATLEADDEVMTEIENDLYAENQYSYEIGDKVQISNQVIITGCNQTDPTNNEISNYVGLLVKGNSVGTDYFYFNKSDIVSENNTVVDYKVGDKAQVNLTIVVIGLNQTNPITNIVYDYSGLILLDDSLGTEYYYFNKKDIITKID